MVREANIICFEYMKHMMPMKKKAKFSGGMWRWGTWGGIIVCGRWDALR